MADARAITERGREVAEFTRTRRRTEAATLAQMYPEMRARAFAVQGVDDFGQLKRVQEAVAELSEGGRWEELRGRIAAELGGDTAATRRHAETVLRTNGFQAYGAARWRAQQARKEIFPYLKYVTMGDGRVREAHAALDGKILHIDDPFWQNHYPPWDYNCRCMAVQLSEAGLEDELAAGEGELWSQTDRDNYVARHRSRDEVRPYQFRPGSLEIDIRALAQAKGRSYEDMQEFGRLMEGRRLGTGQFGADGRERETNVRAWLWQPVEREYRARVLAEGAADGLELLYALDVWTGAEIAHIPGTAHEVPPTRLPLREPGSLALYHNHPGGNHTLSAKDVYAACRSDIASIEAVSGQGWMRLQARARSPQMRQMLQDWGKRLEQAHAQGPRQYALARLEWVEWLDKQRRYGYFEIERGGEILP